MDGTLPRRKSGSNSQPKQAASTPPKKPHQEKPHPEPHHQENHQVRQ